HFSGAAYLALLPNVEEAELSLDQLPDRFARVILPPKPAEPARPKAPPEPDKKEAKKEENVKVRKADSGARRAEVQQRVAGKGLLKILGSTGAGGAGAFADVLGPSTGTGEIASALAGASGVGVATADALGQGG